MGHFSQLRVLFPDGSSLCQVDKKNLTTTIRNRPVMVNLSRDSSKNCPTWGEMATNLTGPVDRCPFLSTLGSPFPGGRPLATSLSSSLGLPNVQRVNEDISGGRGAPVHVSGLPSSDLFLVRRLNPPINGLHKLFKATPRRQGKPASM